MKKTVSIYTPCISIYLPTQQKLDKNFKARHRVKFMRVISKIEKNLVSNCLDHKTIQKILKPAKDWLEDHKFWINQQASLVVFMAEDFFEYYQLPVSTELAIFIDTEFNVELLATLMQNTTLIKAQKPMLQVKKLEVRKKTA